jgi:magnesium-transporting ATPase (P-type)
MQGISYIDTCNLDGETNLKIKTSLNVTNFANSHSKVFQLLLTCFLSILDMTSSKVIIMLMELIMLLLYLL